ncbi:hypothetical protein ASPTUDRAFT_44378 [Aspergillus tubingensis CBS 134.48]|uniref:Uncharacterized protein n=1 Tax=Aspergillus tubingensis (strain CBS 134.48) TaxID=767770 RepID=A0A1L9N1T4_ASPTC|nr:hypothetical protein ASPTUDRAFT_44378 [Aspergillus tubingensis CBS 134.48]
MRSGPSLTDPSRFVNSATTTSKPTAKKAGAPTADGSTMRAPYNTRFPMPTSMWSLLALVPTVPSRVLALTSQPAILDSKPTWP